MIITLKKVCKAWAGLPLNRHQLLIETTFALISAFLAKRLIPFRILSRWLGQQMEANASKEDELPPALRADLIWAFGVWQRYWPYPPVCLTEVVALKIMLRRRKIRCSVFIGVTSDSLKGFQAHTWMRCGGAILPRAQPLDHYKIISVFCS